jgi:secreted PhoX family phosphatase
VPAGYVASAFIPWGEPINALAPAWKPDASNTAIEQEQQVGDNHDGMAFFGFNAAGNGFGERSDEGLLVLNHEYINPEYFYTPGSDPDAWFAPFTLEKARKGQAGHGISVVHVRRAADGSWEHVKTSPYNRRIHGNTPITIQGPAAGNDMMKTAADPAGAEVLGTLNNCANGRTPWGTYLTCEENFNGYFGWNGAPRRPVLEARYGITAGGFGYRWHTVDPRFDVNATPNEPNRHGWVVEIDPFNPGGKPSSARRWAASSTRTPNSWWRRTARSWSTWADDERNEYIYKFVSTGTFDAAATRRVRPTATFWRRDVVRGPLRRRRHGRRRMGTGVWIPLVFGQNGLTEANGFANQAEVLIKRPPGRRPRGRDHDGPPGVDRGQSEEGRRGLRHPDQQQPTRRHHVQRGGRQHGRPAQRARRSTKPTRAPITSGATSCAGTRPAATPPR